MRPIARPLIRLGVTPNRITTAHLILGLATVAAMAWGAAATNLVAGFAWLVACLLDRLDGEVARLGNMCTPAGHKFDSFVDMTLSSLYFLGLGVGLCGLPHGFGAVAVACGLVACVSQVTLDQVAEAFDSRSHDGKILASRWGFDADDAFYLLGPLLWLPPTVRFGAVILAAVGTLGFLTLFVSRLAALNRRLATRPVTRTVE